MAAGYLGHRRQTGRRRLLRTGLPLTVLLVVSGLTWPSGGQAAAATSTLDWRQTAALACVGPLARAGFAGDDLRTAVAVCVAESSGKSDDWQWNEGSGDARDQVACRRDGSWDGGLMQINTCYHPEVSDSCVVDADCNATVAFRLYQSMKQAHATKPPWYCSSDSVRATSARPGTNNYGDSRGFDDWASFSEHKVYAKNADGTLQRDAAGHLIWTGRCSRATYRDSIDAAAAAIALYRQQQASAIATVPGCMSAFTCQAATLRQALNFFGSTWPGDSLLSGADSIATLRFFDTSITQVTITYTFADDNGGAVSKTEAFGPVVTLTFPKPVGHIAETPNSEESTSPDSGDPLNGLPPAERTAFNTGAGAQVAAQGASGSLGQYTVQALTATKGKHDFGLGMAPYSSPSTAERPGLNYRADHSHGQLVTSPLHFLAVGADACCIAAGQHETAFQANTGDLWVVGDTLSVNTRLGMMPATSPSIGVRSDGHVKVAFQSNTGNLWVYQSRYDNGTGQELIYQTGWGNLPLRMAPSTSPSLAMVDDENELVAFQGANNTLQIAGTINGKSYYFTPGFPMKPGTSPSLILVDGSYVVAYQGANTDLMTYNPLTGSRDYGLGMADDTSPSITYIHGPGDNGFGSFVRGGTDRLSGYEIAFQANTGTLWTVGHDGAVADTGIAVAPGTSPSVNNDGFNQDASGFGGYTIAYQGSNGHLWLNGAATFGTAADTGTSLAAHSSPSLSSEEVFYPFATFYETSPVPGAIQSVRYGWDGGRNAHTADIQNVNGVLYSPPAPSPTPTPLPSGCTVPDVSGYYANTADAFATSLVESPLVAAGCGLPKYVDGGVDYALTSGSFIFAQSPAAGTVMKPGDVVTITVTTGVYTPPTDQG